MVPGFRIAILAALAVLGSAMPAHADDDDIRRAEAALAAGNPRAARIDLLNAIKADPADAPAHLLQGRVYLALGDGPSAEAEIARARQAGASVSATRHLMAEALLLQGEANRALAEASARGIPMAYAAQAARIRGRARVLLGDIDGARPEFVRAIRLSPRDAGAWTDLGRYCIASGETAGAVEAADRAVALGPRNVRALTLKGELARTQYGLIAALPWFDRALAIDPDDVRALTEQAATLGDLGRNRAMLDVARHIVTLDPGNPAAFYLQAVLAARARMFDLARAIMQRTGDKLDQVPAAMLLMGVIALQSGNLEQAIDRMSRLVALQPDNIKARRILGAAQWRAGDVVGTIATLQPAADLPQADSYTLTLLGRALERSGDRRAAARYLDRAAMPARETGIGAAPVDPAQITALRRTAAAHPGDANTRIALIRALLRTGDHPAALAEATALERANPGVPQAHVIAGDAYAELDRWNDAADAYRRAANIAFSEPVILRLIDALRRAGNAKAAGEVLAVFLQQNPQNISAQLLSADLAMAASDWPRAIAVFEGLRTRLGDRDAAVLNNLAWSYFMGGKANDGLALAGRAYQLAPANPAIADTFGWLLFKAGTGTQPARGIALVERSAMQAPNVASVRWHLAQAYAATGRPADARTSAEMALRLPGFDQPAQAHALLARL